MKLKILRSLEKGITSNQINILIFNIIILTIFMTRARYPYGKKRYEKTKFRSRTHREKNKTLHATAFVVKQKLRLNESSKLNYPNVY